MLLKKSGWAFKEWRLISSEKANDWYRTITLETLRIREELTSRQPLLFSQVACTQYLVWVGFHVLADDTLESEHWKGYREYARANVKAIAD